MIDRLDTSQRFLKSVCLAAFCSTPSGLVISKFIEMRLTSS